MFIAVPEGHCVPRTQGHRGPRLRVGLCIERNQVMLQTIAIVLLVLWLLGLVTSTLLGGFIHVLLVVAIVLFLLRFLGGARA